MAGSATSHEHLISAFEHRFDYLSARAVLAQVLDGATVAKADGYDAVSLARILKTIETSVARPQAILVALSAAPAPLAAAKAPSDVEAKPADAKALDSKPADAKPADAKPVELKAPESKAVEAKPVDAKPAKIEGGPAADAAPQADVAADDGAADGHDKGDRKKK